MIIKENCLFSFILDLSVVFLSNTACCDGHVRSAGGPASKCPFFDSALHQFLLPGLRLQKAFMIAGRD